MNITITFDPEFDDLMARLRRYYSQELFDLDGVGWQLDPREFRRRFFHQNTSTTADVSVDANANVDSNDIVSFGFEVHKPFFRLDNYYQLWKELKETLSLEEANRIIEYQIRGDFYINDFSGDIAKPYCFNYSTYDVMLEGLPMVEKIKSTPPKHILAFFKQLEQFIGVASNNTHGATGVADLLIVLSYYVEKALNTLEDSHCRFRAQCDVWQYVREQLTSFIYTVNQPLFRANQSPFTNVSLYDRYFLRSLCDDYTFPDGSKPNIKIVQKLQELLLTIKNEEMERTPVTFPVISCCFTKTTKGRIKDRKFLNQVAEAQLPFGAFEFYTGDTTTLSSCCRLRSDLNNEFFNSFGAGSTKIGSLGVVTLNMPRLAKLAVLEREGGSPELLFMCMLNERVVDCAVINNAKRSIIKRHINRHQLPLYGHGLMDIKKQYSTVGVNGLNEALEILGYDVLTEEGKKFMLRIIKQINATNDRMQDTFNAPHNCEQTPSENSSIKLAKKDVLLGYQQPGVYALYSNQFIPLIRNADMLDRVELQGTFDKHFSGGAIMHLNLGQRVTKDTMIRMADEAAKKGVIYWSPCFVLNRCEDGHMTVGGSGTCQICGKPITDQYMRVVGFLTNVKNWHEVRREEDFPNRQFY
jgi:ribonucleoside-triphosphate reductase